MIKMTAIGEWESIHEYTSSILESFGYELERMDDNNPKKFMLKSVLAMGDVDLEFLKEILPKVRGLIYIGENQDLIECISEFCLEKDIPEAINKISFTNEIRVYRNNLKTIQIFSSNVFSEMELASKYMAYNGSKIGNLIKYISQIELNRVSAPFDADLDDIKDMHENFVSYYEECIENNTKLDPEELIRIYENYKP